MERKELRKWIKQRFKAMEFQQYKNYMYKLIDADYLVVFWIEASTYSKSYQFLCGCIYLPDDNKIPLNGLTDHCSNFWFPIEPDGEVSFNWQDPHLLYFPYERYSLEQLDRVFTLNYEHFMLPYFDKDFVLDKYRNNYKLFKCEHPTFQMKICRHAGIEYEDVMDYLQRNKY